MYCIELCNKNELKQQHQNKIIDKNLTKIEINR